MIISELMTEYDSIHSQFGPYIKKVNDGIELLSITVNKEFCEEELEILQKENKHFDIFVNPCGLYLSDFLDEKEASIRSLNEIVDLNIQLEKNDFTRLFPNLDFFFFDYKSMLSNLAKNVYTDAVPKKLNIAIPRIEAVETTFFRFLPVEELSSSNPLNLIDIETSYIKNMTFFNTLHKTENTFSFINPFLFIIKDFKTDSTENKFKQSLMQKFYLDVLEFISDESNESCYLFRGKKSLKISKNTTFTTDNYLKLVNLFIFLVAGEKFLEKITIVRNVFSIYLNDENTLVNFDSKLDEIWKTVQHYFNNYISDNIKDFFKDRDSLFKEAMSVSKSINDQTDKLNNAINNSLISLVVGLTVSIYTSLAKNDIFIMIISLTVFLSFSIVYYQLSKKHVEERRVLTTDQFNHFIDNIYILENHEKEIFKTHYLKNPINILKTVLNRFKNLIVWLNIIVLLVFTIFYFKAFFAKLILLVFTLIKVIVKHYI